MKNKRLETSATIGLAVVCMALVFHLAVRVRSVHAGTTTPAKPLHTDRMAREPRGTRGPVAALFASQKTGSDADSPELNLALYRQLQSQELAAPERNPFSFEPTAQEIQQQEARSQAAAARAAGPPAPPPPPPLPFKTVGYSMQADGKIEAYLSDTEQVYSLHEGDTFDKIYRVVRLTPAFIEIQDDSFHRTVELPFPQ